MSLLANLPATADQQQKQLDKLTAMVERLTGTLQSRLVDAGGSTINPAPSPALSYSLGAISASTNDVTIKQGGCYLFRVMGLMWRTTPLYLRVFNTAAPAPDSPSQVPALRLPIPPAPAANTPVPFSLTISDVGFYLPLGLGIGITTGYGGVDSGKPAAADITGLNVIYA